MHLIDPKLSDEAGRIASLNRYCVLDSGGEEQFDRITDLVRGVFKVPLAVVSLIDVDRQWFKAQRGLDVSETSRDASFCAHTILSRGPLNIADARDDDRFATSPLVTGAPHIRAYLGSPLETPDGYNVGALCAIDRTPRLFTRGDELLLASFAALVVDELELRMIGQCDHLTGAKTRRAFLHDLEVACGFADKGTGALIMFDLDHFKRVNDGWGHAAGDRVLQSVASICRNVLRRSDAIGRLGGEEFAILLTDMSPEKASQCAERIRKAVADQFPLPGVDLQVTASFGVAPLVPRNPELTMAHADNALYQAKAAGRNRSIINAERGMSCVYA